MHKKLKPSIGKDGKPLKVHNPATKLFIKEEGQMLPMSTYWRRRLACGDVVEVTEDEPKKPTKKTNKKDTKTVSQEKKDMEGEQ